MILQNEYPTLITIPSIHRVETLRPMIVPYVLVNLSNNSIFLPKGELLVSLESMEDNIQKIITSTSMKMMTIETKEDQNTVVGEVEKKFITLPDVGVHRKVNLQNAKVTEVEGPKSIIETKLLCLIISVYVVSVD